MYTVSVKLGKWEIYGIFLMNLLNIGLVFFQTLNVMPFTEGDNHHCE